MVGSTSYVAVDLNAWVNDQVDVFAALSAFSTPYSDRGYGFAGFGAGSGSGSWRVAGAAGRASAPSGNVRYA
jgi:hypothetical protein